MAVDALTSGRVRTLIAYLVLHRDIPVPRQRLAFAFWPDSPEAQARANLRNVLHAARHAHPAVNSAIEVTSAALRWRTTNDVAVDVVRFEAAVELSIGTDPDQPDELIGRCGDAVACYGGELLPDDGADWLIPLRAGLAERYAVVLRLMATALIDAGRPDEAVGSTELLVRACPLDEVAHRLNIEAHAAAGDRSGAVRAYHECVAVFDRELGVTPSPETRRQIEQLINRAEAAVPDQRPALRARSGLVGRTRELAVLSDAWMQAMAGGARLVVVSGEPGIGKSRLVEELAAECRSAGAAVAIARSYLAEGELGFAVVASWLRSPDLGPAQRQLGEEERAQLARLLPELGSPASADDLGEAERRRRLFDATVRALAETGPTLLIADDVQWADRASHELIHYLVRQRLGAQLLVVVTARAEDIDAGHPLASLRDSLTAIDRVVDVQLTRLPLAATTELGEFLVGQSLSSASAEALFAESGGNPLFIVEAVRSGWDGNGGPLGMSARLRAVIEARLRVLSPLARLVASAASVVGRPFSPDLLRVVAKVDDDGLAPALDELWRRNILSEAGGHAYDFSHARIREVAYDDLSPITRRAYHAAVAESLATRDGESSSTEIASHLEAAGRPEEALAWFQRAARSAHDLSAYSDALRLIERALGLIPLIAPHLRHQRELELLGVLPLALSAVDGYATDRMSDTQERAVDVAETLGVELDPAFVRSMIMTALCRDEFTEAADAAARLHDHAIGSRDEGLRIESHYLLGIASFWGVALQLACEHFETVVHHFEPGMRAAHHARFGHDPQVVCMSRMANTLWFLGREDEARTAATEALALAAKVKHPLSQDTAMIFACLLAVDLEDHDLLRQWTAGLGKSGLDSLPFLVKHEALLGYLDVVDGQTGHGLDRISRSLDRCGSRNFFPGFQSTIARLLVSAHAIAGDHDGGLAATTRALAMGGSQLWAAEHHRLRAVFLERSGSQPEAVSAEIDQAEAIADAQVASGHLRRIAETRKRLTKRF